MKIEIIDLTKPKRLPRRRSADISKLLALQPGEENKIEHDHSDHTTPMRTWVAKVGKRTNRKLCYRPINGKKSCYYIWLRDHGRSGSGASFDGDDEKIAASGGDR